MYDLTENKRVDRDYFENMNTSSYRYNGDPLIPGHVYSWYVWADGYDESGNLIARSFSEEWYFTYQPSS